MDKNKSRTDLLAAGRKKLQQFRQKKDGKGNTSLGKSSKKSGKPGQHDGNTDIATADAGLTEPSHAPDEQIGQQHDSNVVNVESYESHSRDDAVAPNVDAEGLKEIHVGLSSRVDEEVELDSLSLKESGSNTTDETKVATITSPVISEVAVSEGESVHSNRLVPVHLFSPSAAVASSEEAAVTNEEVTLNEEKQMVQKDIPDTMIQSRQDQGAEYSGLEQIVKSSRAELEEDGSHPRSELAESADALAGTVGGETIVEQSTCEAEQTGEQLVVTESAVSGDDAEWVSVSTVVKPETGNFPVVSHEVDHIGTDEAMSRSSNEECSEATVHLENMDQVDIGGSEVHPRAEESFTAGESCSMPLGTKLVSLSGRWPVTSGEDVSSISLLQLAQLIKGLDEGDFRFLFTSRDPASFAGLEQSKLQMNSDHERDQRDNEMLMLGASLNEVSNRNNCLSEELAHCQSELQAVNSEKNGLQVQFHSARVEIEELSSLVSDLQNKLEKSQGDLSSLSVQLADWKNLVQALEMEKGSLSGSLTSMTYERKKLEEEKEYFVNENEKLLLELAESKGILASVQLENASLNESITSITVDRKKFQEEKEFYIQKNANLSSDIAECQSKVAALQIENANTVETLALVTEGRRKLEHEKDNFVLKNDWLMSELAECKDLVEAAHVETSNLSGSLASMTVERNKLEEEKKNLVSETERLSSELRVHQELLSISREEKLQLEADLKEVNLHFDQVIEENIYFNSCLEMLKAKIQEINDGDILPLYRSGEVQDQLGSSDIACRGIEDAINGDASREVGKQVGEVSSLALGKSLSDGSVEGQLSGDVYNDCFGFVVLKARLEEVEKVTQRYEKAIEEMHLHSESLRQQGGQVAGAGVSKLIQAFESKAQLDNPAAEEVLPEDKSAADPFVSAKEQTQNLRAVLKQLFLDAESASDLFKGERDCKNLADAAFQDMEGQYNAMREHADNLQAINIELEVKNEILKQHMLIVKSKNSEFENLYDLLRQKEINLTVDNGALGKKLSDCLPRVTDLQRQLQGLQGSMDEMASLICAQIENMQKEAAEKALTLGHEWNSIVTHISESVGKLDASSGRYSTSTLLMNLPSDLDVAGRVIFSVDAAIKVMENLQEKLEASYSECETVKNLFTEVNEKYILLHEKNEVAIGILSKIYGGLRELVTDSCSLVNISEINIQNEELLDFLHFSNYANLMDVLGDLLSERVQLISENNQLKLDVTSRSKDLVELNGRCFDVDAVLKLVEDAVEHNDLEMDSDKPPVSRLESRVLFLLQRYKDAEEQVELLREEFQSRVKESLSKAEEKIDQLNSLNHHQEIEILGLKERLSKAEEALTAVNSELQEKATELEQSEQRVSSVREKLSIAVAKGKGLITQRENLKQSLVEKSNELERCSQELQLKDTQILEIETKLKTYSEAGERVEALESELSYIRNSATALRESFLLKDSVLQRVEEILEDLELPEHFHSRDIIEKVDWLARSVSGNPLPPTDWDRKSSGDGGSYSDGGFVVMDGWKEETQPSSNDDLRRKYEELQSKFYGLAEQNEMLEQSLMERNNLIQRWEEVLDKVNMPTQLRSMEPEGRIEWLGSAVSDAHVHVNSLQQKIGHLEAYCGTLAADLEESQRRLSDVEADLESVVLEKDDLSNNLLRVTCDHANVSEQATKLEHEKDELENERNSLQEKLVEKVKIEETIHVIEDGIRRLQDLVADALQDPSLKDMVPVGSSIEYLEDLLRRLIDNYMSISLARDVPYTQISEIVDSSLDGARNKELLDAQVPETAILKKELEVALSELVFVKEERDAYMEKHQSLVHEVEALNKRGEELQELLTQEEQKLASVREKLNVAVRKGKSLVQQRDSLKQTIEEMNNKLERLNSDKNHQESALAEYEHKCKDLLSYPERLAALESDNLLLRNQLNETEHYSQEKGHTLSMILDALGGVDVSGEFSSDPIQKLEQLGKLYRDLHAALATSEQESRKSKKAAELLLAELNEVQDRNDFLQEELVKAGNELFELSKSKDIADAAKLEALSHLEKLSAVHSEERKQQFAEIMELKSVFDDLRKGFFDIDTILDNVLSTDMQFIKNLGPAMQSCLEPSDDMNMLGRSLVIAHGGIESKENLLGRDFQLDSKTQRHFDDNAVVEICGYVGHHLQECTTEIDVIKEKLQKHTILLHEEATKMSKVLETVHTEMVSRTKSIEKERDRENNVLGRNIMLLYEACLDSILEIENRKAYMLGNNLAAADKEMNFRTLASIDGGLSRQIMFSSEEHIRDLADRLLMVVKDLNGIEFDYLEKSQKEMKTTIASLQKELQEKDVQKERVCSELVSQIKEAEASAMTYSRDLQSAKARVHDLEDEVNLRDNEKNLLEQKVNELLADEAASLELQERVRSLTDMLAAKDQEIESLMQALDEEETQMEELNKKVEVLEKVVQQKNLDLENVEGSRSKAVKKLSITVSKFDELHNLSASLLAEVENLQSQLQERDAEISFLRQEVTRCTNDILVASQMSNKRSSDEILELFTWLETMISGVHIGDVHLNDMKYDQVHEHKDVVEKQIISIVSELEDLRVVAQRKDALLQAERSKVEELMRKGEVLENSLQQKEAQLDLLHDARNSGQTSSMQSEILEVEPVMNKWSAPGTSSTSQVRSLRKANNDQVAISIDDPSTSNMLEDEDDDKVHGFKSLTTSRVVPRFTRPVSDMIDGLWVSCDRALMRQPALRLGIIIYWAILHALLATFVV